ncbi:hypothetical protein KXV56_007035, partial [Aspergillus fumigatus]
MGSTVIHSHKNDESKQLPGLQKSSSPDYKTLFLKAEEGRKQEAELRKQAEERQRQAEERERQAEERERQERERNRPTTFGEFIRH